MRHEDFWDHVRERIHQLEVLRIYHSKVLQQHVDDWWKGRELAGSVATSLAYGDRVCGTSILSLKDHQSSRSFSERRYRAD